MLKVKAIKSRSSCIGCGGRTQVSVAVQMIFSEHTRQEIKMCDECLAHLGSEIDAYLGKVIAQDNVSDSADLKKITEGIAFLLESSSSFQFDVGEKIGSAGAYDIVKALNNMGYTNVTISEYCPHIIDVAKAPPDLNVYVQVGHGIEDAL